MPTLKFRQDTVRSVPYRGPGGKHQCVYWDAALEGFGLRVYPSGRRVYVCSYRVKRRKRLATLGRADVLTLDQARRKAITYLGKIASHEDPQDEVDQQRESKRVDELCSAFIEGQPNIKSACIHRIPRPCHEAHRRGMRARRQAAVTNYHRPFRRGAPAIPG